MDGEKEYFALTKEVGQDSGYICQRKNLKEKFTTLDSEWAYYSQGPLSKLVIAPNITLPQTLPPLSSFVSELYIMRSYLQCSHDTCSILQLLLGSGTKGSTDMKKAGGVEIGEHSGRECNTSQWCWP